MRSTGLLQGYAIGYLGGGMLLAINLAMIMLAPAELAGIMTRLTFLTVAVWWFVFTIPLLRVVTEPSRRIQAGEAGRNPVAVCFRRLAKTFREITRYRDLFLFLVAFWFYNDGIGTIIKMATIYGAEIGIGQTTLIGTLLMVQFVGIPFAFLFGWLAKKIGTRQSIYLSLLVYTVIAIAGYFLQEEWQFWALGIAVATVQGGSQALSRSLFGRMVPKSKSAEFFGFFSVSEKFAGIMGPFVFGIVGQFVGNSRLSIVSLIIFFFIGAAIFPASTRKKASASPSGGAKPPRHNQTGLTRNRPLGFFILPGGPHVHRTDPKSPSSAPRNAPAISTAPCWLPSQSSSSLSPCGVAAPTLLGAGRSPGRSPGYTDLDRLVRETAPEIGIVSVNYRANGQVGLMAVEAGLNVLFETPHRPKPGRSGCQISPRPGSAG